MILPFLVAFVVLVLFFGLFGWIGAGELVVLAAVAAIFAVGWHRVRRTRVSL